MSASKSRPAKRPKPRPAKRTKNAPVVTLKVDDTEYVLRLDEISAADVMLCRRTTGRSLQSLMRAADEDPDVDVIAVLVWLARRQAGESKLAFDDVLAEITYQAEIGVDDDEPSDAADQDDDPGEEPAAD